MIWGPTGGTGGLIHRSGSKWQQYTCLSLVFPISIPISISTSTHTVNMHTTERKQLIIHAISISDAPPQPQFNRTLQYVFFKQTFEMYLGFFRNKMDRQWIPALNIWLFHIWFSSLEPSFCYMSCLKAFFPTVSVTGRDANLVTLGVLLPRWIWGEGGFVQSIPSEPPSTSRWCLIRAWLAPWGETACKSIRCEVLFSRACFVREQRKKS